jgi:chemotaxis protein methyltransferase WspC
MNLEAVLRLLRERIGLNPDSVGPAVGAAVAGRMRAVGVTDPAAYARLAEQPGEFQALAEDVAVPETWFFRGGGVFAHLAQRFANQPRPPGRPFRALSVPCSTGDEPYSLAIALAEAGAPAGAWVLDGVDLSARCLEQARRGRYSEAAFRQTDPELRRRYFRPADGGWELVPGLRQTVRFRQGNLLDPIFLSSEAPYDLIFCRNLFIYLHPEARRRCLATLERLLAADGLLVVGAAEPLPVDAPFRRVGPDGAFLYQKLGERAAPNAERGTRNAERTEKSGEVPRLRLPPPRTQPPEAAEPRPAPGAPRSGLDELRRQADGGQLDEALAGCRALLDRAGPSADVYSLMGVVLQARGEAEEANRCFQKALYLRPDHREALTHLMLLAQRDGDAPRADLLRRRLERAPEGEA